MEEGDVIDMQCYECGKETQQIVQHRDEETGEIEAECKVCFALNND